MSNSPFTTVPLSLVPLLLISLSFHVNSQTIETERTILLDLKRQWGSPLSMQSWNSSSSPCDWAGIYCNGDAVAGIYLKDKNITSKIPPSICNLQNLSVLDLSYNYIPGEFPNHLLNCSKLEYLDLSQNYFVGRIPSEIERLSSLRYIDLGANNFSGDIPPSIGRLLELQTLNVYQNQFNGTFPAEIGNLSNLEELRMAYNGKFLPARLPTEFARLKKLKFLWMTDTNLIGEIPVSFANLSSLEHFDLARNKLTGSILPEIFMLKNLSFLYLFHNEFHGEIPKSIEASSLEEIDLSANNLTGMIPESIGNLQNLKILNLFSNRLSGEITTTIGLLPELRTLRIFGNNLTGILPQELGLHSKLEDFEVADNQLTGKLPANLCAGGTLFGVHAFSNRLSGELPETLGNCPSLLAVQLYNNSFSGEVPSGLWSSLNVSILKLSDNLFTGKLPSKLAWNLTRLEIRNNQFSGGIPAGVSSWSNLMIFEASNNKFSGKFPIELTMLSRLLTLSLDGNHFSGQLPSAITSWRSLTTLNLGKNNFSGQIPAAIGSLPDLLYLDLSANQFSGQIPPELGRRGPVFLNLSSNQLSGRIPYEFQNLAYEESFLNNPNLCSDNPRLKLRSCYSKSGDSKRFRSKYLAMILILAITVFLVTSVLTVFVIRDCRRKRYRRKIAAWKLTSFQKLDFTESNILSSLTENNLIGSGGSGKVYRIRINRSGEFIAVKKIWNLTKLNYRLEKEFTAEIQTLGTIRHSNIVKLLCCISCDDSKILVYEYMENQSLDKWIHNKRSMGHGLGHRRLDWPTRLRVAIGAAQGLCYMHHDCSPPIIHRDVKSSNILLDSEFNARLADFGLAKMLSKHGEADTMSAIAGSFGYFAPEYAYTSKVNEKIDVYSFGVVLLELVTGREANDGAEHMSLAEWAWRYHGEGNSINDAIDEGIKEPCFFTEMNTMFNLGLICTSTLPSSRPSMKEVLQILWRCGSRKSLGEKLRGNEYDAAPLLGNDCYLSSYKKSKKVSDKNSDNLDSII